MTTFPSVRAPLLACAFLVGACSSDSAATTSKIPDGGRPTTDAARTQQDGSSRGTGGSTSEAGSGTGGKSVSGAGGSKTDSGVSETDAAAGGTTTDGGSTDSGSGPRCGRGPYITETVSLAELSKPGALAGITVEVSPCNVTPPKTDASGKTSFQYPANLAHTYRVSGAGFTTTLHPARGLMSADTTSSLVIVGPTGQAVWMPDYDASSAEILLQMGIFPPATNDGVTITVIGLPTAKITQWVGQTGTAGAVTLLHGRTTITKLPESGSVTVTGTKPGHAVVMDNVTLGSSGTYPVEKGAVTYVDAYVAN